MSSTEKIQFFQIPVKTVRKETEEAKTITLDIPQSLRDKFQFKQGQYITLKVVVGNKEYRRSYSMSSAPHENVLSFTVKSIPDGIVSNHLVNNISPGDLLEVMQPQGKFTLKCDVIRATRYYLFAAGSGITPMFFNCKSNT
jgi:ring-1,2-phenylacetyl-CoA epoxidase subunit PaaE